MIKPPINDDGNPVLSNPNLWALDGNAPRFRVCNTSAGMFEPDTMTLLDVWKHVCTSQWSPTKLLLNCEDGTGSWISAATLITKRPPGVIPSIIDLIPVERRDGPTIPGTVIPWSNLAYLDESWREYTVRLASTASYLYFGIVECGWDDGAIRNQIIPILASPPAKGTPLEPHSIFESIAPIPKHIGKGRDVFRQLGIGVDSVIRGVNAYPTSAPPESVLAGDEWLRRGDIVFFNSSAGAGKSVAAFHLAMAWGMGLPYLGISPSRPLRILHFAGEDDEVTAGECREGLLAHTGILFERPLRPDEIPGLDTMLRTEHGQHLAGDAFVNHMNRLLNREPADLVIINPLLSFVGGDIVAEASDFLRQKLAPLAEKHDCAILIMHHTVKLGKRSWDDIDPIYSAIGGAEPANVARSILCLAPTPAPGLHVLHVGKRISTGWVDESGAFVTKMYFKRSTQPRRPAWLPVSHAEAEEMISGVKAKGGAPKKCSPERAVEILREKGGRAWRADLLKWTANACGCSEGTAKNSIDDARTAGLIHEISRKPPGKMQTQLWFFLPDVGAGEPG